MPVGMEELYGLQPEFRNKVEKIITEMENRGWSIRIVWGLRTKEENLRLVRQGPQAQQASTCKARLSISSTARRVMPRTGITNSTAIFPGWLESTA